MKTLLLILTGLMAVTGVLWVGYGVMVGFGGGLQQAEASNRILTTAVPGCIGLWILAGLMFLLAMRTES